jgi:AbrB family looped-hinge helix DNA binding protein
MLQKMPDERGEIHASIIPHSAALTLEENLLIYEYMDIQVSQKHTSASTVKLGTSRQIVIPKKLHDKLGLSAGDYLEVELHKTGKLTVTPKDLVDRHPEIDRRLAEAEADVAAGRVHGPFGSAQEMIAALQNTRSNP